MNMGKRLIFLLFLFATKILFSQSCPNSLIYDSTNHIFCSGDTIELSCNLQNIILHPWTFAPGASNNYTVESIPYNPPCPFNISPMAQEYYLSSDDIWGRVMNLNEGQPSNSPLFKFSFYG